MIPRMSEPKEHSLHRRLSELIRRGPEERPSPRPGPGASPLPAGVEAENERGPYYLIERPLESLLPEEERATLRSSPGPWKVEGGAEGEMTVRDPVFFDLETTGFSSCPLFLAATLRLGEGDEAIRQVFARDYAEEAAVVAAVVEELGSAGTIVSFNGKSYDIPFLRQRAAVHHIPFPAVDEHVDLLHVCRRAWKGRFPDFRLQTLERLFTPDERSGDIPGAEIPELYHRFVRQGYDPRLNNVFRHNRRDVVTLVRLLLLLLGEDSGRREIR